MQFRRSLSLLLGVALCAIAPNGAADVVPLEWTEASLATPEGTAPVGLYVPASASGVGLFERLELWDAGPFALSSAYGSVSGVVEFSIDSNRWTYAIRDIQVAGPYSGASVTFRARFRVPPGNDVQFVGFVDSQAQPPPYETDPSGLTDIRIFVAGDEVTLHRTLGFSYFGPVADEYAGSIELYWIVPEPGTSAMALAAIAALGTTPSLRRSTIGASHEPGAKRCA